MQGNIKVLDCTLRDGGQGLMDINSCGIETEHYSGTERLNFSNIMTKAGIDIVEIGCISEKPSTACDMFALYDGIESLSKFLPVKEGLNQLTAGLFIGPDGGLDSVPEYRQGLCECVRVILRYSELEKSLDFCAGLSKKGYKVFVQPMLTMRYTNKELDQVIEAANEMNAYSLYFVDSFGYMQSEDIQRLFEYYDKRLNKDICIGFHAHNNMHMAFENAKSFLDISKQRNVIIDSCIMGMGQGAGNLQTELIVNYLNMNYGKEYSFESILDACEMISKFKKNEVEDWGYSPLRLIPAIFKTAYKYASVLKIEYNMNLKEIFYIIREMPDEMRHRCTKENIDWLLSRYER